MTQERDHSPLPWYAVKNSAFYDIVLENVENSPMGVAMVIGCPAKIHRRDLSADDVEKANAAFIVRACNNHYKLVEALRDYVHAAFEHGNKGLKDSVDPDGDLLHAMKQALAEAEAA